MVCLSGNVESDQTPNRRLSNRCTLKCDVWSVLLHLDRDDLLNDQGAYNLRDHG